MITVDELKEAIHTYSEFVHSTGAGTREHGLEVLRLLDIEEEWFYFVASALRNPASFQHGFTFGIWFMRQRELNKS